MIEQLSDSGFTDGGVVADSVTSNEKQQPVVLKKQALRDLPNENNVTKSTCDSTLPKVRVPVKDPDKVSGSKRLSSEVNPPLSQVPNAANPNGNLVYVRRKTEVEVGKISSSGTAGNNSNADLLPSVNPPVSNDRDQPSSIPNKNQTDTDNGCPSSEPSLNPPTMPLNLQNESQVTDPGKSCTIVPSTGDTCLLPHPVGKSGNTISAPDNKSPHPVGVSGKTVSSVENKSPNPHPVGVSGKTVSSLENKSPDPHPVGVSVKTVSSVENKSPDPHPLGVSSKTVSSVENKSHNPRSLGMFGNSAVSTENKSPLHPLGKSINSIPSAENKSQAFHPIGGNSDIITASAEVKSPIPHPVGNSGVVNSSMENRSTIPSLGKSGNIIPSADNCHNPPASVTTKVDFTKESNKNSKHLQHRQVQPRISLRGLDRSAHEEYLQMLRTLSSAELSQLAVELETRAIQLSLEEAREIARTEMLNVMGKSSKASKSPSPLLP